LAALQNPTVQPRPVGGGGQLDELHSIVTNQVHERVDGVTAGGGAVIVGVAAALGCDAPQCRLTAPATALTATRTR